jgi:hypothetical protein
VNVQKPGSTGTKEFQAGDFFHGDSQFDSGIQQWVRFY